MPTNSDLGFDFSRFVADVAEAMGWERRGVCVHCGEDRAGFGIGDGAHGCWHCLRDGRWVATTVIEAGSDGSDDVLRERAQGILASSRPTWTMSVDGLPSAAEREAEAPSGEGWSIVAFPLDEMVEPSEKADDPTWQPESWLFHCDRLVRYLGRWDKADFVADTTDGTGLMAGAVDQAAEVWESLAIHDRDQGTRVYMFECRACGVRRGHLDAG